MIFFIICETVTWNNNKFDKLFRPKTPLNLRFIVTNFATLCVLREWDIAFQRGIPSHTYIHQTRSRQSISLKHTLQLSLNFSTYSEYFSSLWYYPRQSPNDLLLLERRPKITGCKHLIQQIVSEFLQIMPVTIRFPSCYHWILNCNQDLKSGKMFFFTIKHKLCYVIKYPSIHVSLTLCLIRYFREFIWKTDKNWHRKN